MIVRVLMSFFVLTNLIFYTYTSKNFARFGCTVDRLDKFISSNSVSVREHKSSKDPSSSSSSSSSQTLSLSEKDEFVKALALEELLTKLSRSQSTHTMLVAAVKELATKVGNKRIDIPVCIDKLLSCRYTIYELIRETVNISESIREAERNEVVKRMIILISELIDHITRESLSRGVHQVEYFDQAFQRWCKDNDDLINAITDGDPNVKRNFKSDLSQVCYPESVFRFLSRS